MRKVLDLSGMWKFKIDPKQVGELYPEDALSVYKDETRFMDKGYDDSNWDLIKVPSNWQEQGYLYNGVAWYRRTFELGNDYIKKVVFLRFKGVDYFCDAWINGYYLGAHEGYFSSFSYDITKWVKPGKNLITVKVDSPNDTNVINSQQKDKKLVKGALQDWDANNIEMNPGGIWNNVYIEVLPKQYIENIKVSSLLKNNYSSADLIIEIDSVNLEKEISYIEYALEIIPKNLKGEKNCLTKKTCLVPGKNNQTIVYSLENPKLWWTWDTGEQNLYEILVTMKGVNNSTIDRKLVLTGIREIKREKGWETYLNGRRIFFKGASYLSDQLLSTMNYQRYKEDINLAKNANMNVLRTFCVVEKEEFYQLCDEAGIMVYQDFPIQWSMSDSSEFVRHAVPQVKDMIDLLYNHPSIAIWCFGSEPNKKNFTKLCMALVDEANKLDKTRIIQHANCPACRGAWNFDYYIMNFKWVVDNHFYGGYYPDISGVWSDVCGISKIPAEHMEMVSEFGSQALPCLDSMKKILDRCDIWPPNWKKYARHCFLKTQTMHWINYPGSIEELINNTQQRQAFVLKYIIEFLRARKFAACNGAILFLFNDCWPALTWSIIDYYRKPKKGYYAVKNAFEPILITMDWPIKDGKTGEVKAKIYVINDTDKVLKGVKVKCEVIDKNGNVKSETSWGTDVDENSVYSSGECLFNELKEKDDKIKLLLFDGSELISENIYYLYEEIKKVSIINRPLSDF